MPPLSTLVLVLVQLSALGPPAIASPHQTPQNVAPSASIEGNAQELSVAVRAGDEGRVKALLDAGLGVNSRDLLGGTALLDASWTGNSAITALLIARGADVNAVHRESGATPLKYAVLTSRPGIVQQLLAAGADVQHTYRNGETALHLAAARSNPTIIGMLLKGHASLDAIDRDGNTPFDEAVLHDQLSAITYLLSHGADVNRTRLADGRGALHEASVKGFSDLVPTLLKAGANPSQKDRFGQTPLDLALAYKNGNVISELLKSASLVGSQSAADQAMETASLKGQTEIVQILLKSGLDVNRPTPSGSTFLHDAALRNQARVARLLIVSGAKLEARNHSGGTALHDAALGGSTESINVLLDAGAVIDARDTESGATPLMLAASLDRLTAVQLLLKRGADPKLTDGSGHTALDRARMCDDPALLRALGTVARLR